MKKITDIQPQKKNKGRSNIFINEQFALGASDYSIRKNGLKIGMTITKEQLEQVVFEDELEKAKNYIVDYHLNKSKKTIYDKLIEKEYSESVIQAVMDFIERYKLVDDKEYARKFSHDALFIKKQGKRLIKQTLKQKGVSEEDIDNALLHFDEEEEIKVAKKALHSKLEGFKKKSKNKYDFKNRCYQFLARKGYDSNIISKILHTIDFENFN